VIHTIGITHYRRWLDGERTFEIDVQQVNGIVAAHFVSSMQIDADGAPKGYHEGDEHEWDNNWPCFDWLENLNQSDRHGQQGIGGAVGPAQGFTISATSLKDLNVANTQNTARYVDASVIPYIVLPADFPLADGTTHANTITDCLGCLAYVIDLVSGHATGAVFADAGPRSGEASLATALRLGRKPFYPHCPPKVSGIDAKRFFTIVFPNERLAMPLTVSDIQTRAQTQFQSWGDWAGLAAALQQVPKERPGGAPDDDIATLTLPPSTGPVDQSPVVVLEAAPAPRTFLSLRGDTAMVNAPPDGAAIGTLAAGTQVELIEALPNDSWLRVLATIDGQLRQGYVPAGAIDQR
jgi:hypothetical protein